MVARESTKIYKKSFLDNLRRKAGLSHRQFYKALGWERSRYLKHLQKCSSLSHKNVKEVAQVLKESPEALLAEQYRFNEA